MNMIYTGELISLSKPLATLLLSINNFEYHAQQKIISHLNSFNLEFLTCMQEKSTRAIVKQSNSISISLNSLRINKV